MMKNDFSNLKSMDQKIRSIILNCSMPNKEKKELLHYFNKLVERGE